MTGKCSRPPPDTPPPPSGWLWYSSEVSGSALIYSPQPHSDKHIGTIQEFDLSVCIEQHQKLFFFGLVQNIVPLIWTERRGTTKTVVAESLSKSGLLAF